MTIKSLDFAVSKTQGVRCNAVLHPRDTYFAYIELRVRVKPEGGEHTPAFPIPTYIPPYVPLDIRAENINDVKCVAVTEETKDIAKPLESLLPSFENDLKDGSIFRVDFTFVKSKTTQWSSNFCVTIAENRYLDITPTANSIRDPFDVEGTYIYTYTYTTEDTVGSDVSLLPLFLLFDVFPLVDMPL
jgi:hypothetical protein